MDCELLERMPLEDALYIISIEEPGAMVSLGAKTQWLAVQPVEELRRDIRRLSERAMLKAEAVKKYTLDMLIDIMSRSAWTGSTSQILIIRRLAAAEEFMRSFVPYSSRPVIKCYRLREGIALKVSGAEHGDYWTREEYEEEYYPRRGQSSLSYLREQEELAKASLSTWHGKTASGG